MIDKADVNSLRNIRFAVSAFFFCQGFCFSNWATRIPDIKTGLGLDDASWGAVLLMMPIGQVAAMGVANPLISKFGSRKIAFAAFFCFMAAFLSISLVRNQYLLMIVLILFGLFANTCNLAVNTQAVNIEKLYGRSIMSSIHGSWSVANVVGALIGLLIINLHLNTFQHFLSITVIAGLVAIIAAKYLLSEEDVKEISMNNIIKDSSAKSKKRPEYFLFTLGLIGFCGIALEATIADWGAIYFKRIVEAPVNLYTVGFTAFAIMMAVGRFTSDKVVRKFGERRFFQLSGLLVIIGGLLTFLYPGLVTSTVAFMLIGFGIAGISPIVFSVAARKTVISTQMALTLIFGISFTGFLTVPPLIGYISHAVNLRYAFTLILVLGAFVVVLASVINILKNESKGNRD